ncbi:MAG: hypothetical protein VX333_02345, partial [SAR324 cluster bacterium]|nr:hypothetical protein [SAR324 cluster bacterium]
ELRKDPALRLALDKNNAYAASQSLLSRFENKILGNLQGLHALDGVLQRSIDPLLKREGKARLNIFSERSTGNVLMINKRSA